MSLRIWEGKKGRYNTLILEALGDGEKTAWDIAKYIVRHDLALARGNWYHQSQKVNSRLLRKGGRLEDLLNTGFIRRREDGKYSLTILGFIYVLYQINHAGWKLSRDKLFINYWSFLMRELCQHCEENFDGYSPIERLASQVLAEVFKVYPDKPPCWAQILWKEMSKSTMRGLIEYLTLRKDPEKLSQREINAWILEGVYEGSKKCFGKPPTHESKQLVSLMCNSFKKLSEEDKLMVIQSFKTMIHDAIYRMVRKRKTFRKAFMDKVRRAEAHQIVCYVVCPHCNYHGFSLQDGFKLLSSNFSTYCEKCKEQITTF